MQTLFELHIFFNFVQLYSLLYCMFGVVFILFTDSGCHFYVLRLNRVDGLTFRIQDSGFKSQVTNHQSINLKIFSIMGKTDFNGLSLWTGRIGGLVFKVVNGKQVIPPAMTGVGGIPTRKCRSCQDTINCEKPQAPTRPHENSDRRRESGEKRAP